MILAVKTAERCHSACRLEKMVAWKLSGLVPELQAWRLVQRCGLLQLLPCC